MHLENSKLKYYQKDIFCIRYFRPFGDDWRDHRRSYKYLGTETAGNYTSGTWILLHFLSIHAKSQEDFETITNFWGTFFPCEGCCTHFIKMVKEEINCHMPNESNILKFWKLHNLGKHFFLHKTAFFYRKIWFCMSKI